MSVSCASVYLSGDHIGGHIDRYHTGGAVYLFINGAGGKGQDAKRREYTLRYAARRKPMVWLTYAMGLVPRPPTPVSRCTIFGHKDSPYPLV